MKFNNSTVILIIILLLVLYLLDNIKELEENILKNVFVNKSKDKLQHRHKYFQDIYYDHLHDKKEKLKNDNKDKESESILKELSIKKDGDKINVNLSLEEYKPPDEKYVLIPSMDKHISGESRPGITTMDVKLTNKHEKPLYLNY